MLLQSLLAPEHGVDLAQEQDELDPILSRLFAFAYVWGLGGNLTHSCQQPFTAFVSEQLASLVILPPVGSAFDFFVEVKKSPQGVVAEMRQWSSVLPAFVYDKRMPYFQMLVPTVDTVRYSFLLQVCLSLSLTQIALPKTEAFKLCCNVGLLHLLLGLCAAVFSV